MNILAFYLGFIGVQFVGDIANNPNAFKTSPDIQASQQSAVPVEGQGISIAILQANSAINFGKEAIPSENKTQPIISALNSNIQTNEIPIAEEKGQSNSQNEQSTQNSNQTVENVNSRQDEQKTEGEVSSESQQQAGKPNNEESKANAVETQDQNESPSSQTNNNLAATETSQQSQTNDENTSQSNSETTANQTEDNTSDSKSNAQTSQSNEISPEQINSKESDNRLLSRLSHNYHELKFVQKNELFSNKNETNLIILERIGLSKNSKKIAKIERLNKIHLLAVALILSCYLLLIYQIWKNGIFSLARQLIRKGDVILEEKEHILGEYEEMPIQKFEL